MVNPSKIESHLSVLDRIFNLLIKILIYSSAFYFFSFVTADTDLWGHIKFGKDMWDNMAFQRVDIYSYTALGSEWINHEWLSELVMHFAYAIFGSPGLLMGKLLVGFAIVYLLSRISFHRIYEPLVYGIVFVLSVFAICPGFMIRPQILTLLFTAYFLYSFHLYFERGKNLLWTLPFVMIVWVNCHGGFLIGAGIFLVVVGCEVITCRIRNNRAAHLRRIILWLILTEAAVFMNPYGCQLLGFLYETLSEPRGISEWDFVTVFDLSYLRFKLLALMFLASFFVKNPQRRFWEVGLIVFALIYAFMHQRHTPVFAIMAAPYLTENFSMVVQRSGVLDKIRSLSSYVLLNAFLMVLVSCQVALAGYKYVKAEWNIIVDPSKYPVSAVGFLKQNGIKGKILVPFEWGEYAIWKLHSDCRVSIDGRFRTVYPKGVVIDHFKAARDVAKLKKLLNKYPADIILGRQNGVYQQLISTEDRYIYVYSDHTSIVFLKDVESQRDILNKFRRDRLIYPSSEVSTYFP
jgi:hypothetical protein